MDIKTFNQRLLKQVQKDNYAGYDPFDGLNSKLIDWSKTLKKSIFGLAWIQFFKRSPINLRKLFLVPKNRNPKGVGLFILGLLNDYKRTKNVEYLKEAEKLGDWLLTQQCDKKVWLHSCWGYHFDWKAKAFFVPKGKPNVITTIYVAQALWELSKVVDKGSYSDVAFDSANFIFKFLYTKDNLNKPFIAYIPGELAFVHNASLWGAAWLATVGSELENEEFKKAAMLVAERSVLEQSIDGSWVYGAMEHHQFIDGFHTGYNLEALNKIRICLKTNKFDKCIELGMQYYENNFFLEDGTAKYYNKNKYPLDMHSVAQAIITFNTVNPTESRKVLVKKIINKSFDNLLINKGDRFAYQRTSKGLNKINYVRWTQAWVYYAFSLNILELESDERDIVSK